ncbi:MAG: succinate dehydrogenase cytochrome b subunit [Solirubrobacterales bacterium]
MSDQAPSLSSATGTKELPRGRWLRELWSSTVGKKLIVGVTGVILAGYVILHMLGNLKTFQGNGSPEVAAPLDKYAEFLRTVGEPVIPEDGVLWAVRVLLIAAFIVHIWGTVQLIKRNRAARPEGSGKPRVVQRSLSSRTLGWTGLLLATFVVFHVLQFTTLTIEPTALEQGAVYANVYSAFSEWWLVVLYVAAVVSLGFHLRHGLWSVLQTHGFDKPNRNPTFRRGATATAVVVTLGFAAVPLAILAGALPEPTAADITREATNK